MPTELSSALISLIVMLIGGVGTYLVTTIKNRAELDKVREQAKVAAKSAKEESDASAAAIKTRMEEQNIENIRYIRERLQERDDTIFNLQKQLGARDTLVREIQEDLETRKRQSDDNHKTIEHLTGQVQQLQERFARVEEERDVLAKAVEKKDGELVVRDTKIADQEKKIGELKDQMTKLRSDLDDAQTRLAKLETTEKTTSDSAEVVAPPPETTGEQGEKT